MKLNGTAKYLKSEQHELAPYSTGTRSTENEAIENALVLQVPEKVTSPSSSSKWILLYKYLQTETRRDPQSVTKPKSHCTPKNGSLLVLGCPKSKTGVGGEQSPSRKVCRIYNQRLLGRLLLASRSEILLRLKQRTSNCPNPFRNFLYD